MERIKRTDILGESAWDAETKKAFFQNLLRSVNRAGTEELLSMLDRSDFYYAPSSKNHHSNYRGGLLDHVLMVYETAMRVRDNIVNMNPNMEERLSEESVAVVSLLHDVCKICFYKEAKKWRKDANGQWEEYDTYDVEDRFPIGHGEKSIIILQMYGYNLKVDEIIAIRFHMGMWDGMDKATERSYQRAIDMTPLLAVMICSDYMSSMLLEEKIENK